MNKYCLICLITCVFLCGCTAQEQEPPTEFKYVKFNPISDNLKDKICKKALSSANTNAVSNYKNIETSHNNLYSAKYESRETGYIYDCKFTADDMFYIAGEGWELITPTGVISNGTEAGCATFTLNDPAFNTSKTFGICEK